MTGATILTVDGWKFLRKERMAKKHCSSERSTDISTRRAKTCPEPRGDNSGKLKKKKERIKQPLSSPSNTKVNGLQSRSILLGGHPSQIASLVTLLLIHFFRFFRRERRTVKPEIRSFPLLLRSPVNHAIWQCEECAPFRKVQRFFQRKVWIQRQSRRVNGPFFNLIFVYILLCTSTNRFIFGPFLYLVLTSVSLLLSVFHPLLVIMFCSKKKKGETEVQIFGKESAKLVANTKVHIFGKEKCKTHRQF